jgi:hypothetical protein
MLDRSPVFSLCAVTKAITLAFLRDLRVRGFVDDGASRATGLALRSWPKPKPNATKAPSSKNSECANGSNNVNALS